MIITILANDMAQPDFFAEHGLSIHINHPIYTILFDAGYSDVFSKNAKKLNINLRNVDYIVLSHGHYDHTGGMRFYPPHNMVKEVVYHEDAFFPKCAKADYLKYNGIPFRKGSISWLNSKKREVKGFDEIAPSFFVLSEIPHVNYSDKYYLAGKPDNFHDELILILEEDNELSLFMGCSHFNVVNGIKEVKKQFPDRKIKNLVAGMHLGSKSIEEITEIADYIETLSFDKIIPLHCTGKEAIKYFKDRFKENCFCLKAGSILDI